MVVTGTCHLMDMYSHARAADARRLNARRREIVLGDGPRPNVYPVTGPAPRGDSGCVCFWVSVRVPDGWCECVRVRRVGPEVL